MAVKDIFHLQTIIAYLWVNKHLHIKGRFRIGARHNSTTHKATAPGTTTLLSRMLPSELLLLYPILKERMENREGSYLEMHYF